MEPLYDTLRKVALRRPAVNNHSTYQGTFSPSSRVAQPSQPPMVRQQQETHLRPKYPYSSQHVTIDLHLPQDESVVSQSVGQENSPYRESGTYQMPPLYRSE